MKNKEGIIMNLSVRVKILVVFLIALVIVAPIVTVFSDITALTENVYNDEIGVVCEGEENSEVGMGKGNAFDMFGEAIVTEPEVTSPTNENVQSPTKQYQVAVKKNKKTPTEVGSEENISTTAIEETTLSYDKVGKDMDVKGKKLKTLPIPSQSSIDSQLSAGYLVAIKNPDKNYKYDGMKVEMTEKDLDIAERLVMGEAGTMGFTGCCLVAQAIRDTYYYAGFKSIESVRIGYGYDGSIKYKPNEAARKAVKYILKQGHSAVQHRLLYFYNPRLCESKWHEKQDYILTFKDVRFFDR